MIASAALWIAGQLGVSEKVGKIIFFVGLALLICGGGFLTKCAYDRSVIERHENKVENKILKKVQPANDRAADDRARDTITIDRNEQEAHDAIHSAPDSAPSAAAQRHNCERLRRAGKDTSRLPACSGRPGGGGAQAPAH